MSLPEVCVVYLIRETRRGEEVLLGRKLTGLGRGRIVGPGGKLESGESPETAAVREVFEETGIRVIESQLELMGELSYLFPTKTSWSQRSWAYRARGTFSEARTSDELEATWVAVDRIPLAEMWDDAKYWLPGALAGKLVRAEFEFGSDLATVVRQEINLN